MGELAPKEAQEQLDTVRPDKRGLNTPLCMLLCVVGVFALYYTAIVGVFIASFAAAFLLARKKDALVFASIAIAVLLFGVLHTSKLPMVLVPLGAGVACYLVGKAEYKQGNQWILLLALLVAACCMFAADQWVASLNGSSVPQQIVDSYTESMTLYTSSLEALGVQAETPDTSMVSFVLSMWPFSYYFEGYLLVVVAAIAARIVYRRWALDWINRPFKDLDLSMAVLVPLVVGIGLLAAGFMVSSCGDTLKAVGANLLLIARTLLLVQGVAAMVGALARTQLTTGMRVLSLIILAFFEVFVSLLTLLGLVDLWANFRKLPRKGTNTDESKTARSDDDEKSSK